MVMILTKIFFIKIATVPMYVQELLSIDISVSIMYLQCVLLQCTSSRSVVQPPAAQQSPGVGGGGVRAVGRRLTVGEAGAERVRAVLPGERAPY